MSSFSHPHSGPPVVLLTMRCRISEGNAATVLDKTVRKSVLTIWKCREPVWTKSWLLLLLRGLVMAEWIIRRREAPVPAARR